MPGVEQQEVARAVGVLGLADREAGLAERSRLLVAEVARDLDAGERALLNLAVHRARRTDLGQHRLGHADRVAQLVIPGERLEVHQHRAARVGHVGDVQPAVSATGQVPYAPGVHVAERQLPGFGLLASPIHVLEDPPDLRSREIRRDRKTRLEAEAILPALLLQLLADLVGTSVLPHDCVVDWLAGAAIPHHRRLTLVGDAQGGDRIGTAANLAEGAVHYLATALPDFVGVVLYPS